MIDYIDPREKYHRLDIGNMSVNERGYLRSLAQQVAEYAAQPIQAERTMLWKAHNQLKGKRPMVLVCPEVAWREIIPWDDMTIADPFWRSYEYVLKRIIWRNQNLQDDYVTAPYIEVNLLRHVTPYIKGYTSMLFDMDSDMHTTRKVPTVLDDDMEVKDFDIPRMITDTERTSRIVEAVSNEIGDLLPVRLKKGVTCDTSLLQTFLEMRGAMQMLCDLSESPEWLHSILAFMQKNTLRMLEELDKSGEITPNTENDYVGSGGLGFTDELADGATPLKRMWGASNAQELAYVSPEMYDEFALYYQKPILEKFGLACFACCESLDNKMDLVIRRIDNLRRISVSPWTNTKLAAEKIQDRFIYSWKAAPTIACNGYDADAIGHQIRGAMQDAKGCHLEMILKDTVTVRNDPTALIQWSRRASQLAQEI